MSQAKGMNETDGSSTRSFVRALAKAFGSTWAVTLAVALGVLLYYRQHEINDRFGKFSPADMIDVGGALGGFRGVLCERVLLSSYSDRFDAYFIPGSPKPDQNNTDHYNISDFFSSWDTRTDMRSFYLLEGSEVKVGACFPDNQRLGPNVTSAQVFIFKGKAAFENWDITKTCDSCALQVFNLTFLKDVCRNDTRFTFSLEAKGTDNYYIAFRFSPSESRSHNILLEADFRLNLVKYDLGSAVTVCERQMSCDVPLQSTMDPQGVVVKFGEFNSTTAYRYLNTQCGTRISFWLIMLLAVPVAVATAVVLSVLALTAINGCREKS